VGLNYTFVHMATAAGRNCSRCLGRLLNTLKPMAKPSTRSMLQGLPASSRSALLVNTRSFTTSVPLAATINMSVIDVTPLLLQNGSDCLGDMDDDEGNGRAKHSRYTLEKLS